MIFYKGDDWEIPFSYQKDGDVFDITDITEIKSCFKADDGTTIEVTLTGAEITVTSPLGGNGLITVPSAKTDLVKASIQPLTVVRTNNTGKQFTNVVDKFLDIQKRPC